MTTALHLLAAVPPETMLGMPTWLLNGISVGSLLSFIVIGLGTSKLYTKRQVDDLIKQHEREVLNLTTRYDSHITRTVELYQGRVNDSLTREKEWRDVALKWQAATELLSAGIEPMQDMSETILRILQAWQAESRRKDSS